MFFVNLENGQSIEFLPLGQALLFETINEHHDILQVNNLDNAVRQHTTTESAK